MSHIDIYNNFNKHLSNLLDKPVEWFPNGENCIRIRTNDHRQEFIFTYINNCDWKLETVKSFIKSI